MEDYTLVGLRADGARPVMDVVPASSPATLKPVVVSFLNEHTSCDKVEVWKGANLVEVVQREQGSAQGWR